MPERNPKVRRRLAAGKLRLRLCDLRNLGPRSVSLLAGIGIHTPEDLRQRGALEAFVELRQAGALRSLNMLWALVGAIEPWPEGRDWREVAASKARLPLLLAVEQRERAGESAGGGARVADRDAAAVAASDLDAGDPDAANADVPNLPWVPGLPFDPATTAAARPLRRSKKNRR